MSFIEKFLAIYLVILNIYAFALMRIDKIRAVKDRRHRIPERRLLGASAAGGALGAFAAMRMFRHKTKHPRSPRAFRSCCSSISPSLSGWKACNVATENAAGEELIFLRGVFCCMNQVYKGVTLRYTQTNDEQMS